MVVRYTTKQLSISDYSSHLNHFTASFNPIIFFYATLISYETLTKALLHPFLNNRLHNGVVANNNGQPTIQTFNTFTVPNRFCKGGKATSCQSAWETPITAKKIDIIAGVNSHPPRAMDVK